MDLSGILGSGLLGGITGLVGSIGNGILALKRYKLELEDKKADREHSLKEIAAESAAAVTLEKVHQAGEIEKTESGLMEKSMEIMKGQLFQSEYAQYLPKWLMAIIAFMFACVDVLRAAVRPGGTIYLLYIMSVITLAVYKDSPERFYQSVVDPWSVIAYMGSTALMWWFGDRRLSRVMADRIGR